MSGLPSTLTVWWQNLSQREQHLLQLMTALLLPTMLWFAIIAPLRGWHAAATRDLDGAASRYARIAAASALAGQQPQDSTAAKTISNTPIRTVISRTTQQRGIALSRIQPASGGALGLWISEVDPKLFFDWVKELNEQHGISVRVATVQPARSGTALQVQLQVLRAGA